MKTILNQVGSWVVILAGISSAVFGLEFFLIPNGFFDGGATGSSMFLSEITGVPLYFLISLVNIPFLLLGLKRVEKTFVIRSVVAIILLSVALAVVSSFHVNPITDDKILASVFGGFFLGMGIGLAIRNNAALDGTEIAAIIISRNSFLTIGDVIFLFNLVLFSVIGFVINIEVALYSILTYIVASKSVDFFIHGIEEYVGVQILSGKEEEIKAAIYDNLQRGVTLLKAERGYSGEATNMLFCVITRFEIGKLRRLVRDIDKEAFVVTHKIDDAVGGLTDRRGFSLRRKKSYLPEKGN